MTCGIILKSKEKKVYISKLFCHQLVLQSNIALRLYHRKSTKPTWIVIIVFFFFTVFKIVFFKKLNEPFMQLSFNKCSELWWKFWVLNVAVCGSCVHGFLIIYNTSVCVCVCFMALLITQSWTYHLTVIAWREYVELRTFMTRVSLEIKHRRSGSSAAISPPEGSSSVLCSPSALLRLCAPHSGLQSLGRLIVCKSVCSRD